MLSVNQGSIKYHLLSLWYDSRIEPPSSEPLANTLLCRPMARLILTIIWFQLIISIKNNHLFMHSYMVSVLIILCKNDSFK